jgi:hypothetical protein
MLQDLRSMGMKNTMALRNVTFQLSKETFSAIDSMYVLAMSRLLDLSQLTFNVEITALAYNTQYEFMSWVCLEVDLVVRKLLQSEKILEEVATLSGLKQVNLTYQDMFIDILFRCCVGPQSGDPVADRCKMGEEVVKEESRLYALMR